MATPDNNQTNIEALQIKCFLYKYTSPLVQQTSQIATLSAFTPYTTVLDDTQFYTKYDITDFIVSYSFDQDINQTTFAWTVELQDLALSYGTIDTKLKVKAPNGSVGSTTTGLSFSTDTNSITRLSQYELNAATDTTTDLNIVETAKKNRGLAPASLTVQSTNLNSVLSTVPGLRLSDLIQEYDFISVYLYKNTTPLEQITGAVILKGGYPVFVPAVSGRSLTPVDLQNETVLLSQGSNGNPLFSNELNGYVMHKTITSTINAVDRLVLTGNGWTRLFGASRRAIKPSLFQGSLYQQGQLLTLGDLSATQSVYAGRPIFSILRDLFDLLYRIDFTSTNFNATTELGNSFFNISSLLVANSFPANLFAVPQYLLSSVMKRRNFNYIQPQDVESFTTQIISEFPAGTPIAPDQFQLAVVNAGGQTTNTSGFIPVVINPDIQQLQTYFQFLDSAYRNFSPDTKTPYEIIEEIRNLSFIELFESPNGQFLVRSPQYNNTNIFNPTKPESDLNRFDVNMVLSSSLNIISSNYSEDVENLISKVFTGYAANFIPEGTLQGMEQFAYCDGKLLSQFGLMETTTQANPNINLQSSTNDTVNNSKTNGLFEYAQYIMRLMNAKLKVGTILCDLDNTVQVGHTFFDEVKYKFGYIHHITKHVSVTGTATMTLSLTYVRDAIPTSSNATQGSAASNQAISAANLSIITASGFGVQVEQLPVLTDIENAFNMGS